MSPAGGPDAPLLAVAGRTGSGKSTVCRWLAERGAFVLDADRVGHEVLRRPVVAAELVEAFGEEIRDEQGSVDRRRLGPVVFGDEEALARLNRIVHPPLVAELGRRVAALRRSRACELIVVDAALWFLFESPPAADGVLWCEASEEELLRRITGRDGLDEAEARGRLGRQEALAGHREKADRILSTEGDPGAVRRKMIAIVDELLGTELGAGDPPPRLRHPEAAE